MGYAFQSREPSPPTWPTITPKKIRGIQRTPSKEHSSINDFTLTLDLFMAVSGITWSWNTTPAQKTPFIISAWILLWKSSAVIWTKLNLFVEISRQSLIFPFWLPSLPTKVCRASTYLSSQKSYNGSKNARKLFLATRDWKMACNYSKTEWTSCLNCPLKIIQNSRTFSLEFNWLTNDMRNEKIRTDLNNYYYVKNCVSIGHFKNGHRQ